MLEVSSLVQNSLAGIIFFPHREANGTSVFVGITRLVEEFRPDTGEGRTALQPLTAFEAASYRLFAL